MWVGEAEPARAMRASLADEHVKLVRLCAHLTGNPHIAEDLAQEALLEAWRGAHTLRDPNKRPQWLAGIARNVCRNWVRSNGRDLPRLPQHADGVEAADDLDVELELERDELARLLDRAPGLLPPATRDILVERYVRESPHAEIAERMGLSEDAVSMRLNRGRLLLRRTITSRFRDEAAAYGFADRSHEGWQETRCWCLQCGRHKLEARIPPSPGTISFRCPACKPVRDRGGFEYRLANAHFARLIGDLNRPQSILNRAAAWVHNYYTPALRECIVACTNCGRPTQLRIQQAIDQPDTGQISRGVYAACEACGEIVSSSARGLMMSLPDAQEFRRHHSRIRTLPERPVDAQGQAAVVMSFESVRDTARLDILSLRDSLEVVGIYGDGAPGRDR